MSIFLNYNQNWNKVKRNLKKINKNSNKIYFLRISNWTHWKNKTKFYRTPFHNCKCKQSHLRNRTEELHKYSRNKFQATKSESNKLNPKETESKNSMMKFFWKQSKKTTIKKYWRSKVLSNLNKQNKYKCKRSLLLQIKENK